MVIEKIFGISWQIITDSKRLNKTIHPFILLEDSINEPLLLINKKDRITCLSNVCTHRGNILCSNSNNSRNITCKYHGRTFNLKGCILSAIGFEDAKKFPSKTDNLSIIKTQTWKNFIFVSLKPKINIEEIFHDIERRLGWYPFKF